MRAVFAVVVLAVAASAVNMQHAETLSKSSGIKSPFGVAILAELDAKLAQGGPADDLLRIVGDIRQRLVDAKNADDKRHDDRMAFCETEEKSIRDDIARKEDEIAKNLANQDTTRENMDAYAEEITGLKADIVTKNAEINATIAQYQENNRKRAYEADVYNQSRVDTDECIAAISEILQLEANSLLTPNEGDSAESTQANWDRTETSAAGSQWRSLLESAARKTSNEKAKAAILAAANAEGDVTDLKSLLNKLLDELDQYAKDLDAAEQAAIQLHYDTQVALNETRVSQQTELAELEKDLETAKANYDREAGKLAQLKLDEEQLRSELQTLNDDLNAHITQCNDWTEQYNTRTSERSLEFNTLDQVEQIIRDKLGHLMDENRATSSNTEQDIAGRTGGVSGDFAYSNAQ